MFCGCLDLNIGVSTTDFPGNRRPTRNAQKNQQEQDIILGQVGHAITVMVPSDKVAGDFIAVEGSNGQLVMAQIPQGLTSGDLFQVKVPSAGRNSGIPSEQSYQHSINHVSSNHPEPSAPIYEESPYYQNDSVKPMAVPVTQQSNTQNSSIFDSLQSSQQPATQPAVQNYNKSEVNNQQKQDDKGNPIEVIAPLVAGSALIGAAGMMIGKHNHS